MQVQEARNYAESVSSFFHEMAKRSSPLAQAAQRDDVERRRTARGWQLEVSSSYCHLQGKSGQVDGFTVLFLLRDACIDRATPVQFLDSLTCGCSFAFPGERREE